MKPRLVLTLGVLATALAPVLAEADPPPIGPANAATQVVPFLGTATKEATAQQRKAAHLPDGVGLTVQHVLEGSPAAVAGVRRHDVLHRLGDQILVNDPQLRVLLRTFRPGDEVELALVRRSETRSVKIVLGKRRVPVGRTPARELLRWMLMPPDAQAAGDPVEFAACYEDEQHMLMLACGRHGMHLEVRDKQGKVLFEGPVDTRGPAPAPPRSDSPQVEGVGESSQAATGGNGT